MSSTSQRARFPVPSRVEQSRGGPSIGVEDRAAADGGLVAVEERAGQLEELLGAVVDDPVAHGPAVAFGGDEAAPGEAAQVLGHPWLGDVDAFEQLGLGGLPDLEKDFQQPEAGRVAERAKDPREQLVLGKRDRFAGDDPWTCGCRKPDRRGLCGVLVLVDEAVAPREPDHLGCRGAGFVGGVRR